MAGALHSSFRFRTLQARAAGSISETIRSFFAVRLNWWASTSPRSFSKGAGHSAEHHEIRLRPRVFRAAGDPGSVVQRGQNEALRARELRSERDLWRLAISRCAEEIRDRW